MIDPENELRLKLYLGLWAILAIWAAYAFLVEPLLTHPREPFNGINSQSELRLDGNICALIYLS